MKTSSLLLIGLLGITSLGNAQLADPAITLTPIETSKQLYHCQPGPWGDLEYYYTYLEAPLELMDTVNPPSQRTIWHLPGKTLEEIQSFLFEAGVSDGDMEKIHQASRPFAPVGPYRLFPPDEVVLNLSPPARQRIYQELHRWPVNRHHYSPVIIESKNVRDWFSGCNLREAMISRIERVCYPIGSSLAFSDLPLVLAPSDSDAEERALLKALTRTRSLILRMRISAESDFEALKEYWTAGYKNKDIVPIFESISRTPEVELLDFAHLLPPTPRKYLYTYPSRSLGVEGIYPDSFWAALNFFEFIPREDFSDPETQNAYIRANFDPALAPYRYGDLLILRDPLTDRARHASVMIADDIVYTKNGRSILRPFMLMKLGDLMARHGVDGAPRIEVWRKRER